MHAQREHLEAELAAVDAELEKGEDAIERYLLAFEAGTLSDEMCRKRLDALAARASELRDRRSHLVVAMADEPTAPTKVHLAKVRARLERAMAGEAAERKALVQALVHEIRVESRASVRPVFRFPTTPEDGNVRALARSAPSAGLEPAHPAPEAGALSAELRGPRPS